MGAKAVLAKVRQQDRQSLLPSVEFDEKSLTESPVLVVLVVDIDCWWPMCPSATDDDAAVCTDRQATRYLDEGQGQLDPQSTVRQGIRVVWSSVRKQNA